MTVDDRSPAPGERAHLIVGNLVGAVTVEVVAKISGRLESVGVRIGDRRAAKAIARGGPDRSASR
jgi:hypothetical protein